MKMFIGLLCCLFFGARVCLGVPEDSSDANQQELTGSDDKVSQLLFDLYKKRVNESVREGKELYDSDIGELKNEGDLSTRASRSFCKRHAMIVNFPSIFGKTNPYIQPTSYRAYRCSGQCPYPIPAHMNPTMHAVIQRLMSEVNSKWPSPCCVPTTLKPISVLYYDENDVIKIKEMKEMFVERCGCR